MKLSLEKLMMMKISNIINNYLEHNIQKQLLKIHIVIY